MTQVMKRDESYSIPALRLDDIRDFVFERFNEVKQMCYLVKFHSVNKFLIISHSSFQLNKLGNIVANHEKLDFDLVLKSYKEELKQVFKKKPTTMTHYNTLQHILGHFSPDFTGSEKRYFLTVLQNFKNDKANLAEVLQLLRDGTAKYDKSYLSRQTYFLFFTNPN